MVDIQDEENNVFNIRLAKLTGFYQLLDPRTIKYRDQNIYHIVMAFCVLILFSILMIFVFSCVYCWTDNLPLSLDYFWKTEITVFTIYKMWIIVHHSDDIWNCLSITRFGFTSLSFRNKHILDRWRKRSMRFTNIYSIMYLLSLIIYVIYTLAFSKAFVPIKNHDGAFQYYRASIVNYYLIVSDETYNAHYYSIFVFETFTIILMTILLIIYDNLVITLCLAICCQMQMVCIAFESVGHKSLHDHHSPNGDDTEEKTMISNKYDLIYDELKTIIMDHQAVLKIYEKFLHIFGRIMLLHVFFSSLLLIILLSISIMSFSNVDRFMDSKAVIQKLMTSIPTFVVQILIQCYIFDNIHNQKDSLIFALYSSNWTEMDMKCKKLILLTMKMNNANQKKLKFTRTKIVNLEMFFKTMGDCYTVISVLINYIKTKD